MLPTQNELSPKLLPDGPSNWVMERFVEAASRANAMFDLGLEKGYHLMHDSTAMTAVEIAITNDKPSALEHLLAAGAVHVSLYRGCLSPLALACSLCKPDMVRILLDAGHAVDFGGIDLDTPLSYACISESADCVSLLLSSGADPTLTFSGRPSLREFANSKGSIELVGILDAALAQHEAQGLDGSVLRPRSAANPRL